MEEDKDEIPLLKWRSWKGTIVTTSGFATH